MNKDQNITIEQAMSDKVDGTEQTNTTVLASPNGVEIAFEGHGTKTNGENSPVIHIERVGGRVKLYVWGDINSEDPTHVMDLSGALVRRAA